MSEAAQVNVARGNWRADLLRVHAAELERIIGDDPSPAAASIKADADAKRAEADLHETAATLERELDDAKEAAFADPKNVELQDAYRQAAEEITAMRQLWRGVGEVVAGTWRPVMNVDNFPEPSDEEVLASHGGK